MEEALPVVAARYPGYTGGVAGFCSAFIARYAPRQQFIEDQDCRSKHLQK